MCIRDRFGHSVICLNGRQCTCGRKGCIDIYCSATGLILTPKEQMNKNPDSDVYKRQLQQQLPVVGQTLLLEAVEDEPFVGSVLID